MEIGLLAKKLRSLEESLGQHKTTMALLKKKKAHDVIFVKKPNEILEHGWQSNCESIRDRCSILLQSQLWADCEFAVGKRKEIIKAHRLILATSSPVFAAMLYGPLAEKKFPIDIPDVEPDVFQELLSYLMTSKLNVKGVDFTCELHYLSKKYLLPHLMLSCTNYLSWHLEPSNACFILEYARLVEEDDLTEQCLKIIQARTTEVLEASSLEDVSLETLTMIYSMEPLGVHSEVQLYNAAERYARARDRMEAPEQQEFEVVDLTEEGSQTQSRSESLVIDVETDSDDETKMEDRYTTKKKRRKIDYKGRWIGRGASTNSPIRRLLHQIRFLAMTPKQFAECPTLTTLLTTSEVHALIMNIASSNTHVLVPKGFSTNRNQRTPVQVHSSSVHLSTPIVEDRKSRMQVDQLIAINGVDALQYFQSAPFYAAEVPWRLVAKPLYVNIGEYEHKYLSIDVECNWDSSSAWSLRAQVVVSIIPQYRRWNWGVLRPHSQKTIKVFSKENPIHGWTMFILWSDLQDHGFVSQDSLMMKVGITLDLVDFLLFHSYNNDASVEGNAIMDLTTF